MDSLGQRNRVAQEELALMIEQEALQKIGGGKKLWVFVDEAQKSRELFDQVKVLYDTHKGKDHIKFILTGSAHLNLHKLTAETLAGRIELLSLREFNLKEMSLLQHPDLSLPPKNIGALREIYSQTQPFAHILKGSLKDLLIWGGLPETLEEKTDRYRLKYLGDYLQTYLEKDIRSIDAIGDLALYQSLMKMAAELTGHLRDDKKIIEALHCSRQTLSKYRNYMLATLQYTELFPYIESSVKRLIKSPKGYLINNGLVSYLTGIHDFSILLTTGLVGHRLENWFLNEIKTWLDTKSERNEVYFWRAATGAEADFVVTIGKKTVPFEVTYATRVDTQKVQNLRNFMKHTPEASFGILCYMGNLSFDEKNRILFLPAWMV